MLCKDLRQKDVSQVLSINIMKGGDEECHLGQAAHYHQDCIMAIGQGEPLMKSIEIESQGHSPIGRKPMRAKWLVMEGLAMTTDRTGVDIISDECDHLGLVELVANVLDRLGDARVTSKAVVMTGMKDI